MASGSPLASLLERLASRAAVIPVQASAISVLKSPKDFFDVLTEGLSAASKRVTLASLYVGVGAGREAELLQALKAAVDDSSKPLLRIHVLLDALRGNRPTADRNGELSSSSRAVAHLLGPRMRVSLFHTPALRGLLKRVLPPRVNEIIGVSHVKAYIFDDTVVMSGANLSSDYFTARQDRYMLFRDCPQLADWLERLIEEIGMLSYTLQPDCTIAAPSIGLDPVRNPAAFRRALRARLELVTGPTSTRQARAQNVDAIAPGGMYKQQTELLDKSCLESPEKSLRPSVSNVAPESIHSSSQGRDDERIEAITEDLSNMAEYALGSKIGHLKPSTSAKPIDLLDGLPRQTAEPSAAAATPNVTDETGSSPWQRFISSSSGQQDTVVVPMMQLGVVGLRQEELLTDAFLRSAQPGSTLIISSPYFNLPRIYMTALAKAVDVNIDIVTASPSASGFFGAKGAAGVIPDAYALLQQSAWRSLQRSWRAAPQTGARRRLLEYSRPAWQYHAKGIWHTPPGEQWPIACVIGSSNFGRRSLKRDLECQLLVMTTDSRLRKALADEVSSLLEHAKDISESPSKPPPPRTTYKARLAATLMRSFL